MSSYHRNRKCGPCSLCGKTHTRYAHFCSLSVDEQQYILDNTSTTENSDSCICHSYTLECKRFQSEHVPNMFHPGEKKEKM